MWVSDAQLTDTLMLYTRKRIEFCNTSAAAFARAKKSVSRYCLKSKSDYIVMCKKDIKLVSESEQVFKDDFTNWVDYLGIPCDAHYNLETCKKKIGTYLEMYPHLKGYRLDLSRACKELCEYDSRFPNRELWLDFYKVRDLSEIIIIPKDRHIILKTQRLNR